jgi:hypothetical protein
VQNMTEKNKNNIRHLHVREITLADQDTVPSSVEKMVLMVNNIRKQEPPVTPPPLPHTDGPDME